MNIKKIRSKTGKTQKEFSEMLNIPVRTIQDWESKRRTPPEYVKELIEYKITKEMEKMKNNTIESLKNYITEEIKEKGLENNQIQIDFTDLFEEFEELKTAAEQLGYQVQEGEGLGVYWIYKEDDGKMRVFQEDVFKNEGGEDVRIAILIDEEEKEAYEAVWDEKNETWETDFSYDIIKVDSLDVAGTLDFTKAKKLGYKFIE